jgi:predicted ester cyclase
MSTDKQAIATELFNGMWNQHDMSVVDRLVAPDAVNHGPFTEQFQGAAGTKGFAAMLLAAFPNLRSSIDHQEADGEWVKTYWTAHASHTGPLMGFAPTGKHAEILGVTTDRIVNGKVVESWTAWDPNELRRQLGV